MAAVLFFLLIWLLVGWLGRGLVNQARYDRWTTPEVKKKEDEWLFWACLLFGPLTAFCAGVVLVFQAVDVLEGNEGP